MKRMVVTGGAGFIGSRLVRAASVDGAAVTVIDDLSSGSADNLPPDIDLIQLDVADGAVSNAIAAMNPNVIVHAAAQVSVMRSIDDPVRDYAVNVQGTRNVIEGARVAGCRKFVFVSSGGAVYGEADGAAEDAVTAPASPYGRNKLLAEELVAASGIPYAVARLANVYGTGQRAGLEGGVVAIFVDAARTNGSVTIYGDGTQIRDFVFVDDVVAALSRLAVAGASGTWNVGTGHGTSVHDLLRLVEQAVGHEIPHEHRPARIGEILTSRLAVDRIAADIGWRASTSLPSGLAATVRISDTSTSASP